MALTRATDKIVGDSNGNLNLSGIVTASSFVGSGSGLTGVASTDHIKTSTNAVLSGIVTAGTLSVSGVSTFVGVGTFESGLKIGPTAGVAGTFFADGSYITAGIITATTFHGSGANLTGLSGVSVANQADNRLITATGTTDALNGESKLTFDGDKLNVKNSSGNAGIDLNVSNNTNPRLDFNTANVASSGIIKSEESGNGSIMEFHNKNSSGGEQQVMTLTRDRNVSINDGNLIVANGHGIDFSATADPSSGNTSNRQELLDDYEEGQWVPEYSGSTAAGSVSYSYRKGYYIKIGAQVTVWIEMTVSSASGMSGNAQISNLPFNKNQLGGNDATNSDTYYYSGTINWYIQYHAENKPIFTGWMPNNNNVIRIYNADHWGGVTSAPLNTTGRMSFMYIYTTSA